MQRKVKLTAKEQKAVKKAMADLELIGYSCIAVQKHGGWRLKKKYAAFYDLNSSLAWPLDGGYSRCFRDFLRARTNHRLLLLALFLHVGSTEGL